MEDWLRDLMHTSQSLCKAERLEQIFKGFSPERKYRVYMADGTERLLRVCEQTAWVQKKAEYAVLQTLQAMGVKASRPIELGVHEKSSHCYMVLSYLTSDDAKDVLSQLSGEEQYEIGREAGSELAKMHTICTDSSVPEWFGRCMKKHGRYVDAYKVCGYQFPQAEKLLSFIESHAISLREAPNRFLHDDFHVANLIVHEGKYAGAIDFNRMDWGDPVHDFTKLAFFSRDISTPFCIGQLRGYLEQTGGPNEAFWIRYCVYAAMAAFSSLVWTLRVVPHQLEEMLVRISRVCQDHHDFERYVPVWYQSN